MKNRLGELSSTYSCDICGAENVDTTCTEQYIVTLRYNKKVHVHIFRCAKCAIESKSFLADNQHSEANTGNGE